MSYSEEQLREAKKELGITDKHIAQWAGYKNAQAYDKSSRIGPGQNKLSTKERIEGVVVGMYHRFKEVVADKFKI